MSWIVELTVKAVEGERGLKGDRVTGVYTFAAMPAEGSSLAAAWAKLEEDVHTRFLARLEPGAEA